MRTGERTDETDSWVRTGETDSWVRTDETDSWVRTDETVWLATVAPSSRRQS